MEKSPRPPCRLFTIFAREARVAVIFRRGPSIWTQLLLWHTDTDEVVPGQWFKGRIYERRCDLSPDGRLLVYFVSKFNGRTVKDDEFTYAWTAVSRPPYLTALALWPKGDCWHGGGHFENDRTLLLNHWPEQSQPHLKYVPSGLDVQPNPDARGENDPLFSTRLTRDGWSLQQEWKISRRGGSCLYVTEAPEIRVREHQSRMYRVVMTRRIDCLKYSEAFTVVNNDGQPVVDVGKAQWVDWDQKGRLVIMRDGKLLIGAEDIVGESFRIRELADFNPHMHESVVAPKWATRWD